MCKKNCIHIGKWFFRQNRQWNTMKILRLFVNICRKGTKNMKNGVHSLVEYFISIQNIKVIFVWVFHQPASRNIWIHCIIQSVSEIPPPNEEKAFPLKLHGVKMAIDHPAGLCRQGNYRNRNVLTKNFHPINFQSNMLRQYEHPHLIK